MARAAVSESEASRILAEPKTISQNVVWKRKSNEAWLEARVNVRGGFRGKLEIVAAINLQHPSRYGFSLLLNECHRINGLDVNANHKNT